MVLTSLKHLDTLYYSTKYSEYITKDAAIDA